MRVLRSLICIGLLLLLVPALTVARRILPIDTRPLVAERYAGWTGVLSLWIYQGWPAGDGIGPWLNRCVEGFEKRHPGVYLQPQFVDADALTGLNDTGILPPDLLLFPPSLLPSPEGLVPVTVPQALRPALRRCGMVGRACYAVPIALGGYLWVWNAQLTDALPDTWREGDLRLSVPEPENHRRWDAALLALCAGGYSPVAAPTPAPDGVELGLADAATPAPTTQPLDTMPRRLPRDFQFDPDAWQRFVNGEATAMPVSQREVRRLQKLAEQGRGPDWRLARGDRPFTDQLLCLAVVDKPRGQMALCREFIDWMLTDDCQGRLHQAGAFSVTDAPSGYIQSDPLWVMEATLRDGSLVVPRIFDKQWSRSAGDIVRKFISNDAIASTLWLRFREVLD